MFPIGSSIHARRTSLDKSDRQIGGRALMRPRQSREVTYVVSMFFT